MALVSFSNVTAFLMLSACVFFPEVKDFCPSLHGHKLFSESNNKGKQDTLSLTLKKKRNILDSWWIRPVAAGCSPQVELLLKTNLICLKRI